MGLFELKKSLADKKKKTLIKKLAVEEEKAQKRYELNKKQAELESLRSQISAQKGEKRNKSYSSMKKTSLTIGKGLSGTAKKTGELLKTMAENSQKNQKKTKGKKSQYEWKL